MHTYVGGAAKKKKIKYYWPSGGESSSAVMTRERRSTITPFDIYIYIDRPRACASDNIISRSYINNQRASSLDLLSIYRQDWAKKKNTLKYLARVTYMYFPYASE